MSNADDTRSSRKAKPNSGGRDSSTKRGYIGRQRASIAWDEIPQHDIGDLVQSITGAGCAVILGKTSDGGALSITILDGDERYREWPHTTEEFAEVLAWVVGRYSGG